MIAAAVTTSAAEATRGTAASGETSTAPGVRAAATTSAAVTTAMLSQGWRGEANKPEGDDS